MCGIVGIFSFENSVVQNRIKNMMDSIAHRGPDDEGFICDKNIGFGHKRLSIIDLSNKGNQPMISKSKRFIMVYNGEVYNYKEIAIDILNESNENIDFNSSTDSEVILEAFDLWGVEFVHKLNGMFAIAIFDNKEKVLYLFRDRLGIKPLYYQFDSKEILFGSELKALKIVSKKSYSIDHVAISQFLQFGFIPAPQTIYNEVKKIQPGTYLKIKKNEIETHTYWNIKDFYNEKLIENEKEALVRISDLMISSLQYQLKSDVPFGVFLSGGIDSSLIAAQANSISYGKINTFSIGFDEKKNDESIYAKKISSYLGTSHNEFIFSQKDSLDLVESILSIFDEPFADSSFIPMLIISKMAKSKVKVVLSGEGGDELFMGYGSHLWAKRMSNPLLFSQRKIIKKVLANTPNNKYRRISNLFDIDYIENLNQHIFSQEQYYFSLNDLDKILVSKSRNNSILEFDIKKINRRLRPMEIQSLFDLKYYLSGDLLTKIDRTTMKHSLEARVPFLDHRLVEFSLNLSPNLKYKNGVSKYILKEVLYQYMPKEFFNRPKQGFSIPLSKWLKSDLKYLLSDYLNQSIIEKYEIIKYSEVSILKNRFINGEDYLFNKLWNLIILHKFFKDNNI
jgi:asparagine synthase (glutamine-hydrolysing)